MGAQQHAAIVAAPGLAQALVRLFRVDPTALECVSNLETDTLNQRDGRQERMGPSTGHCVAASGRCSGGGGGVPSRSGSHDSCNVAGSEGRVDGDGGRGKSKSDVTSDNGSLTEGEEVSSEGSGESDDGEDPCDDEGGSEGLDAVPGPLQMVSSAISLASDLAASAAGRCALIQSGACGALCVLLAVLLAPAYVEQHGAFTEPMAPPIGGSAAQDGRHASDTRCHPSAGGDDRRGGCDAVALHAGISSTAASDQPPSGKRRRLSAGGFQPSEGFESSEAAGNEQVAQQSAAVSTKPAATPSAQALMPAPEAPAAPAPAATPSPAAAAARMLAEPAMLLLAELLLDVDSGPRIGDLGQEAEAALQDGQLVRCLAKVNFNFLFCTLQQRLRALHLHAFPSNTFEGAATGSRKPFGACCGRQWALAAVCIIC